MALNYSEYPYFLFSRLQPIMRKLHKKQILELLKTLDKVTDEIKRLFAQKQIPTVINLLADCQDGAISIGDFLEGLQGKSDKIEQLLKDFSETLYKASNEVSAANAGDDFVKQLKKELAAIKSWVKDELKATKIEIAFFPYTASMWDSLESIYLTAKNDPDCEAYVVPIPYYDLLPGGKFGQVHYDASEYPSNIPVVDWKAYDVEERHPDMIFVHNPYDDLNIVTSVHPNFYCRRLRNLTDCLVYVPYFVGDGVKIQEHFCSVPGCLLAHKVIVQTEEERKIYVREYNKFTREHGLPGKVEKDESKFLALGSPKLDKAINAKREDFEIPHEWEKLLGNGKKVVFYNTSIAALLEHSVDGNKPSNKYLQKVKSVFEFFKKQSDAVLLWRPHPLLESTIKSMRPWLAQEYAEMVNEYRAGGYGIYDDSQDLNRAIALSDIYYGDASSVGVLFKIAKKHIFWQMFETPAPIVATGLYDDGVYIWFINWCNMLYKHNKQSKKTDYEGVIAGQSYGAYRRMVANNNKLYFAPLLDDRTIIYDMDKKSFERIDFNGAPECDSKAKFQHAASFKNFIYFIPVQFPAIVKLNVDTHEAEYFSQWVDDVSELKEKENPSFFFSFCVVDAEIILLTRGANAILIFNMETSGYEIKEVGEKSMRYTNICFDGQNYYLSLYYENYVIKWNRKTNETLKIEFPSSFFRKNNIQGNFLIRYLNEHIWLFPAGANNAYKININTNEITELPELTDFFDDEKLDWFYAFDILENENSIYAITFKKGIVEYNVNTRKLNFIKPDLEVENGLIRYICDYKNWKSDYDAWKSKLDEKVAEYENSGTRIWKHLKEVK